MLSLSHSNGKHALSRVISLLHIDRDAKVASATWTSRDIGGSVARGRCREIPNTQTV